VLSAAPVPGGVAPSGPLVMRVGTTPISKAQFDRRLTSEIKTDGYPGVPLDPPGFNGCVAGLVAHPVKLPEGVARPSRVQMRGECASTYATLRERVLHLLISFAWVTGGAAELGLHVTDQELQQKLEKAYGGNYSSEAAMEKALASTGETVSDVLFNLKYEVLSEMIRHKITVAVGPITKARVAQYYKENTAQFVLPEQRDLGLIHTRSKAVAERVRRELAHGVAFATVAKSLAPEQSRYVHEGLVVGLESGVYQQKALNDAIFSAKPHVVSGPVRVNLVHVTKFLAAADIQNIDGYYVFEIEAVRPAKEKPLAQVQAELAQVLPKQLPKQALVKYVKGWRARWLPRTDCQPGYIVRKCRQYKLVATELPEDEYTLN
jgi:foldase protein PrsA